jgi:hypothetical protein
MSTWNELKEQLPTLPLTPMLRHVAGYLAEGRSTREIARLVGIPESRVKYCTAYVLYVMRKSAPSDAASVRNPKRPQQPQHNTGVALDQPRSAA